MSPRSKELNEEMRAQSIQSLVTTARRMFAERGYFNCKVSDVARAAGMSQGNVYWYFSSKEELLKAVLVDGFESLGALFQQAATDRGTCLQKMDHLLDELLIFIDQRGDFNQVLLSLMGHGGPEFLGRLGIDMDQIGLRYTRAVAKILVQGQEEGVIPQKFDPNVQAMFFFGLFNGLNLTYGQTWAGLPRPLLQGAVFRLLGISPQAYSSAQQSGSTPS